MSKKKGKSKDVTRRRRFLEQVNAAAISDGCRHWLSWLAIERSNKTMTNEVFGRQNGMAEQIHRSRRTITRYCREAERAGLIAVRRIDAERCRVTGQWRRPQTNRYFFCVKGSKGYPKGRKNSAKPQASPGDNPDPYNQYPYGYIKQTPDKSKRPDARPARQWTNRDPKPFTSGPPGGFGRLRAQKAWLARK
jgi:hypothetical protein